MLVFRSDKPDPLSTDDVEASAITAFPYSINLVSGDSTLPNTRLRVIAEALLQGQPVALTEGNAILESGKGSELTLQLDPIVEPPPESDGGVDGGLEPDAGLKPDGGTPVPDGGPGDTLPPSKPANLRSPAQTDTTVELAWDASVDDRGVVRYRVHRTTTTEVCTSTGLGCTAIGLTPARYYTFRVTAEDAAGNVSVPSDSLLVSTASPPDAGSFYRGVNMNGPAVSIDADPWQSFAEALDGGLSITSYQVGNNTLSPNPSPDLETALMLQSYIWNFSGTNLDLQWTVPSGSYQYYFWVYENHASNFRSFDLLLEGTVKATQLGNLPFQQWVKYGPYPVTVLDGVLNIQLKTLQGDPEMMGMALFQ